MEGSQISFYYCDNGNESAYVATYMHEEWQLES